MTHAQQTIQWIADVSNTTGAWSVDVSHSLKIVIVVAIVQAIVILKLYKDVFSLQQKLRSTKSQSDPEDTNNLASLFSKALTGSLDRFSIGEVIQFLNSIRETGILDVVDENVEDVHRLMVLDGEIVDAFNGALRGEPAIRAILNCKEGSFTFIRGDLPTIHRSITVPTMSLLMDAYKEADESRDLVAAD